MNKVLGLIAFSLLLTACDSVKDSLGMSHYQADEFNLQQNPPLSMPPNYSLMPPRVKNAEGKSVPLNASAEKALQVVGGGESAGQISGESSADLKDKAGAADDSIREKVDKEAESGDGKLSKWKEEFIKNARSISGPENVKEAATEAVSKPITE
ncbi:MAG: DUF3035 domain-containing protein [Proteobacteria bacterium]|nr:DUF3035 domain-containing protein [Pseudomonadota bacterium]